MSMSNVYILLDSFLSNLLLKKTLYGHMCADNATLSFPFHLHVNSLKAVKVIFFFLI